MTSSMIAPEAPRYVTVAEAAEALDTRVWPVVDLIRRGEIRTVQYGALVLCSAYDVEQLGGVLEPLEDVRV